MQTARTDVCFSGAVGLGLTDLLRAAAFSAQHLNLALASGDPVRIARGLALEMGIAPGAGEEGLRWAAKALPVVERLSDRHGTAYHRGLFFLAQGHVAHLSAQWRASVDWFTRAEQLLEGLHTADVHWSLQSARVVSSISAVAAGDLVTAADRVPHLIDEARRRGDVHSLALMAYPGVMLELARDQLDAAERLLAEIGRAQPSGSFDFRDFTTLHCALLIERYRGREQETWRRISESWRDIERSKLLVVNIIRITALAERASAALGQAAGPDGRAFRRIASQCIAKLKRERLPHATALAGLAEARLRRCLGDESGALAILTQAGLRLDSAGLAAHGDCARRATGVLMGGATGRLLIAEADRRLRAQGVREPARFASMMMPGLAEG